MTPLHAFLQTILIREGAVMKKHYEKLETKVIHFAQEDVITASGCEKLTAGCTKLEICVDLGPIKTVVPCMIEATRPPIETKPPMQ